MLYFTKHPDGPELPEIAKTKRFRSYVSMANWADAQKLSPGKYWARNDKGTNLWTAIREVSYSKGKTFHVEGRGNI